MPPLLVVEDFGVLEDRGQRILLVFVTQQINRLGLQDAEKRLGNRIVPAIPFTAHTLNELVPLEHPGKIRAGIYRGRAYIGDVHWIIG
jgi:hypothetical protein